jgi:hypothetical protein
LLPTFEAVFEELGTLPEGASVHLDSGYDSLVRSWCLRGLELG